MRTLLLLPGMDGTGELFERFIADALAGFRVIPVRLPEKADYDELERVLLDQLPEGRFTIVAESFTGPLAIRIAARASERVEAIVFSNTFAIAPRSPAYALLPWALMVRIPPPGWVARRYLLGRFQNRENLATIRRIARTLSTPVMARRVAACLHVNELATLANLSLPMLYLRGTEDRLVLDRSVEAMQRANPSIVRREIAAPHLLLQTVPEEAWSHISSFH